MSSIFKNLQRSEVFLSDFNSKKYWQVTGSRIMDLGVKMVKAYSGSIPYVNDSVDFLPYMPATASAEGQYPGKYHCNNSECESSSLDWPRDKVGETCPYCQSGTIEFVPDTYNSRLYYESLKHLYYQDSLGDGTREGNYEVYPQSTLTISESRVIPQENYRVNSDEDEKDTEYFEDKVPYFLLFTIPGTRIGTGIEPGTFKIDSQEDLQNYVLDDYVEWDYFEDLRIGDVTDFEGVLKYTGFLGTWSIKEGQKYPSPDYAGSWVFVSGSSVPVAANDSFAVVGDIIYTHGQAVIVHDYLRYLFSSWDVNDISWKSNKPVFTENVVCKVRDIEFNASYNPTVGDLQGKEQFTPYISSLGLYNSAGELLAVVKLSKPIKKAGNIDTTIVVRIDLG